VINTDHIWSQFSCPTIFKQAYQEFDCFPKPSEELLAKVFKLTPKVNQLFVVRASVRMKESEHCALVGLQRAAG
jgi:hypothetical protein